MTDLSTAAQAIVKAFDNRYELLGPLEDDWQEQCLAAALRKAAGQLICFQTTQQCYDRLLAIVTELEGTNAPA
jgi:hypothetical protein